MGDFYFSNVAEIVSYYGSLRWGCPGGFANALRFKSNTTGKQCPVHAWGKDLAYAKNEDEDGFPALRDKPLREC
jgi:hypothetical protein